MENRRTIFDYLGEVFCIFGITIAILNVMCHFFGESAIEVSSMFALGSKGLTIATMLQFLLLSMLITVSRFVYFTDRLIKNASIAMRTAWMLFTIILLIAGFIYLFEWFPVHQWQPWAMFFLCFGISFGISTLITFLKERMDNKNMQEALMKLKKGEE